MLHPVRVITVCTLLAPFTKGSFATRGLLENCTMCEEFQDPFGYASENCCDMENIGDFCWDIFTCLDFDCIENEPEVTLNKERADINLANAELQLPFGDALICEEPNCDMCWDFTEKVIDECCPYVLPGNRLDLNDPDITTCENTIAAFEFTCLFSNCLDSEDLPWNENEDLCNNTTPTTSPAPSVSLTTSPTGVPTTSTAPTTSHAPTTDCTCCDCTHTSGCNPDPHYYLWNNEFYDFQGGCDQIAIDNDILQLQIRTRPRTYYSTVTAVGLLMKADGEVFHMSATEPATSNISTSATVVPLSNGHDIVFDGVPNSYIRVTNYYGHMAVQAYGQGYIFSDSEGMFGSWNYGGVRFRNGTAFDTSGGWSSTRQRSIELALDWKVPLDESLFTVPSNVCDGSSDCGPGEAFPCGATRKLRDLQAPNCTKSCDDIDVEIAKSACKEDLELLGGDNTFTCQPAYVEPLIEESDSCDFKKLDDGMCMASDTICALMDGYCKENCVESDTHVCLPGLCTGKVLQKGRLLHGKKPGLPKNCEKVRRCKTVRTCEKGKKCKRIRRCRTVCKPKKKERADCMCYAPKRCSA